MSGTSLYTNNAVATLASGVTAVATTIALTPGQGALFPNPVSPNYFWVTLVDAATQSILEIGQCTARATDSLTVVRGQQGTTASAYLANDRLELRPTASSFNERLAAANNLSDVANAATAANNLGLPSVGGFTMRNRIINGAMQIDQWHGGSSIANINGAQYSIDRFQIGGSVAGKFASQQNAGSVTPPPGFSNYIGITSSSAYSVLTGDSFQLFQSIEANNVTDFAWGTAAAQPVTLSFYVYSSLTGTFGGAIRNYAQTRSYIFTYSIPVANTWTKITVTIPGDTGGSWVMSGTGGGVTISYGLGVGSTFSGAAGTWTTGNYVSAIGAVSVVGTTGATFYITGVDLEPGTISSNERRLYGAELALCQRYYWAVSGTIYGQLNGAATAAVCSLVAKHPVSMRSIPSVVGLPGTTVAASVDSTVSYTSVSNGGIIQTTTGTFNSEL